MTAMDRYGNAFCAGQLIDHHGVVVNDALRFDYLVMQRCVGGAGGLDAELMKIFVVVFHHEGQILDVEVVAG